MLFISKFAHVDIKITSLLKATDYYTGQFELFTADLVWDSINKLFVALPWSLTEQWFGVVKKKSLESFYGLSI